MTITDQSITFDGYDNPVKVCRHHLGLSQSDLGRAVGISKHAILRSEQGMFVEPLPTLLNYLCDKLPVDRIKIIQQYDKFQIHKRAENSHLLGDIVGLLDRWRAQVKAADEALSGKVHHPLVYLRVRAGFNPTSLSKALCLNQSTITYFEKNPINQRTVPDQLCAALKQAGYSDHTLEELRNCYDVYRVHVLGLQNLEVKR